MKIIEPVTLGDVASGRPSPKCVYDKTGMLITVPAGQVAVTYDPTDLSKAPYVLVEPEATNYITPSTPDTVQWQTNTSYDVKITRNYGLDAAGQQRTTRVEHATPANATTYVRVTGTPASGTWTLSMFLRSATSCTVRPQLSNGTNYGPSQDFALSPTLQRYQLTATFSGAQAVGNLLANFLGTGAAQDFEVVGVQLEPGSSASSAWETNPTFVSRSSTATYYDATGMLQTAAANVARMTYDPSDLSKPPYLMVEASSTNRVKASQNMQDGSWGTGPQVVSSTKTYRGIAFQEVKKVSSSSSEALAAALGTVPAGTTEFATVALMAGTSTNVHIGLYDASAGSFGTVGSSRIIEGPGQITTVSTNSGLALVTGLSASVPTLVEVKRLVSTTAPLYLYIYPGGYSSTTVGDSVLATRFQAEDGPSSSYIPTAGAAVTRAADVVSYNQTRAADTIATGAGLVYSNVAIPEPDYSPATTYAKGYVVHDPATHLTYTSMVDGNMGQPLSSPDKWGKGDVTNRWKMLDQYNNTQTAQTDEIVLVLSPRAVAQGVYLGNVDASEVRISVVDIADGLVYQESASLLVSNSDRSFYNWHFRRLRRKNYHFSLALPPYVNALITICLKKPGGSAKCGMCVVGLTDEFGPALLGLTNDGKDYSSTTFAFDGTSSTVIRPYAKRMSVDVSVDNDQLDYVQQRLWDLRQRLIVVIGGPYGSTAVAGRISFKNVIDGKIKSKMTVQIEGAV